jgi:hypothetical protein
MSQPAAAPTPAGNDDQDNPGSDQVTCHAVGSEVYNCDATN